MDNQQLTNLVLAQTQMLQTILAGNVGMVKKNAYEHIPNMSIDEFISNIEILSPTKLLNTDLPNYYALIINHNLEKLKNENRPINLHKKKRFYYYSNNEWTTDNKIMSLIKNAIYKKVVGEIIQRKNKCDNNEEICICISKFFDVDKYPQEKLMDKIFIALTTIINNNYDNGYISD
jgi:hypothetical protein